ncbi:MAG: exodeoxyribonuclease VII small subunit [Armatimonadota bacterium]
MAESERSVEELGFEEALAELEAIVGELEGGQVELERMLERFERAMALRRHCTRLLAEAETRIAQLVDENGTTVPFALGDTDADQA